MHVVYSLGPGGMENGVVNIANGLQGECFQTTIVCIRSTGPFVERLAAGIDVVCLEKSEGFDWSAIKRLRRLIDAQKPDLMHTHNLGALMYASLARGLLRRCPAIVHGEHAELNAGETTFRQRLLRRWFDPFPGHLAAART